MLIPSQRKSIEMSKGFSVIEGKNNHIYDRQIEENDHHCHKYFPENTVVLFHDDLFLLSALIPDFHLTHNHHQKHHDHCHYHGNRTSEVPFSDGDKLILDQITDQEVLSASEQLRNKERADRRKKHQCDSVDDSRK